MYIYILLVVYCGLLVPEQGWNLATPVVSHGVLITGTTRPHCCV